MYSKELEELIDAALADGVLTEKEKQILLKKAQSFGIDLDEFEMVLDARLAKIQKANRPIKEKRGNVITCPYCGAVVQAYIGKCPECGYEFENVAANLSSQKLAALLQQAKTDSDKKEIIETFPIPNTKTDLLEFLTALKPRILDVGDTFANSYYKKYQECIEKAKISFANDTLVKGYIEEFEKINHSINLAKKKHAIYTFIQGHKLITSIVAIALIGIGITLFFSFRVDYRGDKNGCKMMVMKSIKKGNLNKAEYYLYSYRYNKYNLIDAYSTLIDAYLKKGSIEDAKQVANHYNEHVGKATIYKPLYEYLMKHGKYEDAEKYISINDYIDDETYYNYLKTSIESMCKDGRYGDAQKFLRLKCNHFDVNSSIGKYSRENVLKDLDSIITHYL